MEPLTIIGGVVAAAGAGLGIGAGTRLLPLAIRAHRDLQVWKRTGGAEQYRRVVEHEEERLRLAHPPGQKRDSSIVGICAGALRHTDGAYTCAWEAQPAPTLLAHEHVIEARCDELARMLAVDKPPGTVIQFRFSSGPDPGAAVFGHIVDLTDLPLPNSGAVLLHLMNINFYRVMAANLSYRRQLLSLWARVPVRQKGDDTNSGLSAFIPAALAEQESTA